jgi:polysaccharide pyruvyl transferase WcaK-like protein
MLSALKRPVRILVDQSGYDLLNIGDVAMLQSCVSRLMLQWPSAEIMVIAHEATRLEECCPGTTAIGPTFADLPVFRLLPRRPRLASEQAWKITAPYFSGLLGRRRILPAQPRTAIQAVQSADLVVASGGSYMTDTWWWHAAGVLSLLYLAQRLGKPTAMFGQGIGPINQRALRAQTRMVVPRLIVLGLREDRIGRDLALSLGIRPDAMTVTGDDALELIDGSGVAEGDALGVNVRVSRYAGLDPASAVAVGDLVLAAAAVLQAPIVGLPVSRYEADADLDAIHALIRRGDGRADVMANDIASSKALISAAASCRAIITGSYHAAVLGLAQGVPTVCLTKSSYYDAKFGGLRALFPGACFVVSLDPPDLPGRLHTAIQQAWHLPAPTRAIARNTAAALRSAGRNAYAQFQAAVQKDAVIVPADSQGLVT